MIGRCRIAVSTSELKFAVQTAENTGRSEKIHRRVRDPFLNKLHIEDWLAIGDQRAVDSEVKTPDQPAELPGVRAKLLALHRHIRYANRRAETVLASGPRFAHLLARWFHHRVVNFFELHAGSAHADERNERREHFVRAFPDLVDARVAHHSLQWKIGHVGRAAMDLEYIVDALPDSFGREHFQHRSLEHV